MNKYNKRMNADTPAGPADDDELLEPDDFNEEGGEEEEATHEDVEDVD